MFRQFEASFQYLGPEEQDCGRAMYRIPADSSSGVVSRYHSIDFRYCDRAHHERLCRSLSLKSPQSLAGYVESRTSRPGQLPPLVVRATGISLPVRMYGERYSSGRVRSFEVRFAMLESTATERIQRQ
jgi:hypothetical protein